MPRISILKPNSSLTPSLTTQMCCLMCYSLQKKKKILASNCVGKIDWEWGQWMHFINDCCLVCIHITAHILRNSFSFNPFLLQPCIVLPPHYLLKDQFKVWFNMLSFWTAKSNLFFSSRKFLGGLWPLSFLSLTSWFSYLRM